MAKKIKTALVGCGYWGSNLLRNLSTHPESNLVGFADGRSANLEKAAALYPSAKAYSDFDKMLEELRPEAVVIATPPASHSVLAVKALEKGAHVLVEKPMAASSEECDRILAASKKAGKKVMIDNTLLFYPPVMYLIDQINKGELGKLIYYDSIRVNLGGFQPQANVLWDLAPHEFSILDLIAGQQSPEHIVAIGAKHPGSPTESICYLNLKYASGFNAHLHLNWAAPMKQRQLTVCGDKRMAVIDDSVLNDKVRIYDKRATVENGTVENFSVKYHSGEMVCPVIEPKEALAGMLSEFFNSIHEDRKPKCDGEGGARVVRMLEAASKSLENHGQPEAVTETKSTRRAS